MEDFFPFLQNPADTGFDSGTHLPQRRHAGGANALSKFATTVQTEQRVY